MSKVPMTVRGHELLQDELQMVMRLSGTPDVKSITREHVLIKNLSALGFYLGSYRKHAPQLITAQFAQLFAWFEAGKLKPHVSHQLDLAQAAEALELLSSRKSTGKVVLTTGAG